MTKLSDLFPTFLKRTLNFSDVADPVLAFNAIKQQATTIASGVVQLATQEEVTAGTDTAKVVTAVTLAQRLAGFLSSSDASSRKVVYISDIPGIHGDSSVGGGGTDDAAILNAIFLRQTVPTKYVFSKFHLVSGLRIGSYTCFEFLPGAGLYLADGSNCPIIRNANPTTGAIIDKNIALIGGEYNGNGDNQTALLESEGGGLVCGLGFYGIENLILRDIKITHGHGPMGYAVALSNWNKVFIENYEIQQGLGAGRDGLHFFSGSGARILNGRGQTGSDFIALNSSDYHDTVSTCPWVITDGDITDVLIDGVLLEASANGIGILDGTHLVDNITVRNVTGTVRDYGMSLWNAWGTNYQGGKIGRILIDGVRLTASGDGSEAGAATSIIACYSLGGGANRIDDLQIRNVQWNSSSDSRPWMVVDGNTTIGQMQIEGVSGTRTSGSFITNNGAISELQINHVGASIASSLLSGSGTITTKTGDAFSTTPTPPSPSDGPVAEYLFASGNELADTSGNGHSLTNNNGVTFANGVATFNGTNYLTFDASALPTGGADRTVSIICNATAIPSDTLSVAKMFEYGTEDFNELVGLMVFTNPGDQDNAISVTNYGASISSDNGQTGARKLVTYVLKDGVSSIYVGSTLMQSDSLNISTVGTNGYLGVGSDLGSPYTGTLEKVRVWARALTTDEITTHAGEI